MDEEAEGAHSSNTDDTHMDLDLGDLGQTLSHRSFVDIPVETLLHICSFLDAKFISEILSFVCQRFYDILSDESIWKSRISKLHNRRVYPALPVNDEFFDWKQACIEIEQQKQLWMNRNPLRYHKWNEVHYAAVDAIHLLNNGTVCVTGGRDRSIVVWNLSEVRQNNEATQRPVFHLQAKAHQGWIWNFASSGEKLYSCSWDTYINCWNIGAELQKVNSYKCDNAVLSIAVDESLLAAGLYNSKIALIDVRIKNDVHPFYSPHRRSVLALAMDANYIISASEDQTVAVYDRRAGKIFKEKIKLGLKRKAQPDQEEENSKAFPMCMSYKNNQLYVGDSKGLLHLVNPVHGKFEFVKTYDVGHTGKLTSIEQGRGYLITGSTDGSVRILTPTDKPCNMMSLQSGGGEVTGIAYQNNILATSGTNCSVELWIPNILS